MLPFSKWHGCGNDFVVVDNRRGNLSALEWGKLAVSLLDRHFGVGGDQLLVVEAVAEHDASHVRMLIFNASGSQAEMCGNGVRAIGKMLQLEQIDSPHIHTLGGVKAVTYSEELIRVNMGKAQFLGEKTLLVLNQSLSLSCIDMGNPHAVWMVEEDVDQIELEALGPLVEKNAIFPQGTNFEIVSFNAEKTMAKMRVWERGAGLTLACGTGACAVFAASKLKNLEIKLPGGVLNFHKNDAEEIFMTGPAEKVFEGSYILK
jgi:diaminopimelate epimerase